MIDTSILEKRRHWLLKRKSDYIISQEELCVKLRIKLWRVRQDQHSRE